MKKSVIAVICFAFLFGVGVKLHTMEEPDEEMTGDYPPERFWDFLKEGEKFIDKIEKELPGAEEEQLDQFLSELQELEKFAAGQAQGAIGREFQDLARRARAAMRKVRARLYLIDGGEREMEEGIEEQMEGPFFPIFVDEQSTEQEPEEF